MRRSLQRPSADSSGGRAAIQADAVRGSLWTLLSSAVGLPLSLAVTAVSVRSLGTEEFAVFTLYLAVYLYALPLFNGGFTESAMQSIAEAHAQRRTADLVEVVRRMSGFHLLVQGPLTVGLTVVLLRDSHPLAIVLVACAVTVAVALEASSILLAATARNAAVARFALAMNLVSAGCVITTAITTRSGASVWAAHVACLAIAPTLAFVSLDGAMRRAVLRPLPPRGWPKGFVSYAGSALVGGYVSMLVFGRSELFVLSAFGKTEAVAAFALAIALAGKLTTLVDSLMAPIAPVAAGLVASAPELVPRALGRTLRISTLLAGGTMALTVPAAAVLLPTLFGAEYADARAAVVALGVVSCLITAAGPLLAFAFATRSVRRVLVVNVACLAIDAGLAFGLVGPLGLWGAVTASCAAQTTSAVLLVVVIARRLDLPVREVAAHLRGLVVCVPALAVGVVAAFNLPGTVLPLLVATLASAMTVLAVLAAWPAARLWPEDVSMVATGLPTRLREPAVRLAVTLRLARVEPT